MFSAWGGGRPDPKQVEVKHYEYHTKIHLRFRRTGLNFRQLRVSVLASSGRAEILTICP